MIVSKHGENYVASLIRSLPANEFHWFVLPSVGSCLNIPIAPQFVILNVTLGFYVLEVRDYKSILNVHTGGIKVERRSGAVETVEDPFPGLLDYMRCLQQAFHERAQHLLGRGHLSPLMFPGGYALVLPNIDEQDITRFTDSGIWSADRLLCQQDLNVTRFERALRKLPMMPEPIEALGRDLLDIMRGVLDSALIVRDHAGNDVGTLSVEQARVAFESVKTNGKNIRDTHEMPLMMPKEATEAADNFAVRLVRGVAGSGKSLVLARRAQHLAETYPDQRHLAMAYNAELIADLRLRISSTPQLDIATFTDVCCTILGDAWRQPIDIQAWLEQQPQVVRLIQQNDFSAEFVAEEIEWRKDLNLLDNEKYLIVEREGRVRALSRGKRRAINQIFDLYLQACTRQDYLDFPDLSRRALYALDHRHPLYQAYDNVLIDEAQDFAPTWIELSKRLLKPGGTLFLCDDPTQSLFRAFSWRRRGVDVVGHSRTLRVPFRNTLEIARAAFSLVYADPSLSRSNDIPKPDLESEHLRSGDLPTLINCQDAVRETRLIYQYAAQLSASGIPPSEIAVLCHRSWMLKRWSPLARTGVRVKSFKEMKGLEFTVVIIPQIHSMFEHDGGQPDETFISEMRRRMFTAMTRAREILLMFYVEHFPTELSPILPYVGHEITWARRQRRRAT